MAYELVARPNFTIPGKDVPLRQAGPSAFDQEAVQRARAAAEARRVPQGVPNAATATQTGIGGGQSLGQNAVVGGAPGQPAGGANPLPAEPVKGSLRGAFKALASPAAGGVLAAGGQAVNEFENLRTGDPTKIAESTARIGGAGAGWLAGAKLGAAAGAMTGPLAPLAVPALGLAGGLAGAYLGPKLTDAAVGAGRATLSGDLDNARLTALGQRDPGVLPTSAPTATKVDTPLYAGNSDAGAGRSSQGYDDPRRLDRDPSRTSLGASRDFSKELGQLPAQLPTDLRQGVVHKTVDANGRPVYSGSGVGANPMFVDGVGKETGSRGFVSTVPGMSKELIAQTLARPVDPLRGLSPGARAAYDEQVRYAQGVNAAGAAMAPGRGGAGGGAGGDLNAAVKSLRDAGHVVTHSTLRALIGDQTQRRGQDMTEGTTRRGQDMTQQTALRGQDMDLQGRVLPKQMEMEMAARMRAMRAQIFNESGGDPRRAAGLAQSMGLDPKDFLDAAKVDQELGSKAAAGADRRLESLAISTDKDGKKYVDPGKMAEVRRSVAEMAPEFQNASEGRQQQLMPTITAGETLRQEMNRTQNNSRIDALFGNQRPDRTKLDLRGAQMDGTAGLWDAFGPEVEYGDVALRLGDGSRQFVSRKVWDQAHRELVESESKKK